MMGPVKDLALWREDALRLLGDWHLHAAMVRFYAELDAEIAALAPVCWSRGLCCRFGAAGHNLFVTTLELLYFAGRVLAAERRLASPETADSRCPHQIDGRCGVREFRPLGCRVYFCQASSAWWQPTMSERWLSRLRLMHEQFAVPYAYVEWLAGLRQMRSLLDGGKAAAERGDGRS